MARRNFEIYQRPEMDLCRSHSVSQERVEWGHTQIPVPEAAEVSLESMVLLEPAGTVANLELSTILDFANTAVVVESAGKVTAGASQGRCFELEIDLVDVKKIFVVNLVYLRQSLSC